MRLDLEHLPNDTTLLHQLVRDLASSMEQRNSEIEKLRLLEMVRRHLNDDELRPREIDDAMGFFASLRLANDGRT